MLSERLKTLRTRKRFSIRYLARKLDVSASTYRAWENGGQIRGEPYVQLAHIFGVSVTELLTGEVSNLEQELANIEKSLIAIRSKL